MNMISEHGEEDGLHVYFGPFELFFLPGDQDSMYPDAECSASLRGTALACVPLERAGGGGGTHTDRCICILRAFREIQPRGGQGPG